MRWVWSAVALGLAACPAPAPEPTHPASGSGRAAVAVAPPPPADAPEASEEERLAAIQKAMNELDEAAQSCWAAAAVERFDLEGDVTAQIDIGPAGATASIVKDTARNGKLAACLTQLLGAYRWAPPLHGQTIQLPFRFRAPDGQSVIDRKLVPWNGQAKVSVAVLLDESNTGNDAASMFEIAIAAGGTTGNRIADRAEVWYFLGPATVGGKPVAAGDMMYVRKGGAREVTAPKGDVHAVLVVVPGGREGTARAGALPTPPVTQVRSALVGPQLLPASAAKTYGPATIFAETATIHDPTLAASILTLSANTSVPEHVHANETELLYVLAGSGTMTVNGVALAVSPTSVVQIPKATKHAFTASADLRAVQIYTPAGPEQRFKAKVKP
jgi:quercetin dioxygenase-like cupin family protein